MCVRDAEANWGHVAGSPGGEPATWPWSGSAGEAHPSECVPCGVAVGDRTHSRARGGDCYAVRAGPQESVVQDVMCTYMYCAYEGTPTTDREVDREVAVV